MSQKRTATHPGIVFLEDVMRPLELTATETAEKLGVEQEVLSQFIAGDIPLSSDMATRIAKMTDTSPESWMNIWQNNV